jgi:hypothetical protein
MLFFKNTPSIALQALFSFWIFKKKSQKVLRCGSHQNGFPNSRTSPQRAIVAPLERATFFKAKKTMLALSVRGF